MRLAHILSSILLLLVSNEARGACAPLKFGYVDQHRPPYYMGSGPLEPELPGASVELVHDIIGSARCPHSSLRLPHRRLRPALEQGLIQAMPLDASDADTALYALPLDRNGKLDAERALRMVTVVYVRADDAEARSADPLQYFRKHQLGVTLGSPFVAFARQEGLAIDDGALDAVRNLEKLKRRRIDGFAAGVVSETDLDAVVAAQFGGDIVRHDKLLRKHHVWLAFNKDYYASNKADVEAMWHWIASHGHGRLAKLLKKYDAQP
jgi:hypothetical protein